MKMYTETANLIGCLLLLLCLCIISACDETGDERIRFGLSTAPVTLDPRYATDAVSHRINRLIYRQLVDFDQQQRMQPSLANWQVISDTHYRFSLGNDGRQFHDGSRLTAADVKASYEAVLDEQAVSPHRGNLLNISTIRVVDENTVDFQLHRVDPLFPGRLVIGIMPAALLDAGHPFNQQPVGSGLFRFIAWPREDQLLLERISDRQLIEFNTVRDSTVRVLKLLRGELDLVQNDLPFELLDWLSGQDAIVVENGRSNTFSYLGFNLRDPALRQEKVRMAIAHGIDRENIIRHVLGNAANIATGMLPPSHWAGHPDLKPYGYDPKLAGKLLRQAGYGEGRRLRLEYKTSSNPLRLRLATIIQYQLKQIGIDIELKSYDWGTYYGDIKTGRFQMYSLSWVGLKMPDIFRYAFHSDAMPPQGANRGYFSDKVVDTLIEEAELEKDPKRQASLYRQLQQRLHDLLPYVPLWYEHNVLARQKDIRGYRLSVDGEYDGLGSVYRER